MKADDVAGQFIAQAFRLRSMVDEINRFYDALDYLGDRMGLVERRTLLVNARSYMERLATDIETQERQLQVMLPAAQNALQALAQSCMTPSGGSANLADELEPDEAGLDSVPHASSLGDIGDLEIGSAWDDEEPATRELMLALDAASGGASVFAPDDVLDRPKGDERDGGNDGAEEAPVSVASNALQRADDTARIRRVRDSDSDIDGEGAYDANDDADHGVVRGDTGSSLPFDESLSEDPVDMGWTREDTWGEPVTKQTLLGVHPVENDGNGK